MYIREGYNKDCWSYILNAFVIRNSGRKISLENEHSTIIERIPFKDIEYLPTINSNKLTLVLGNQGQETYKPIFNPSQIHITTDNIGNDLNLEISDIENEVIFLHFDNLMR